MNKSKNEKKVRLKKRKIADVFVTLIILISGISINIHDEFGIKDIGKAEAASYYNTEATEEYEAINKDDEGEIQLDVINEDDENNVQDTDTANRVSELDKGKLTGITQIKGGFRLEWRVVSGATKYYVYREGYFDNGVMKKIATVSGDKRTYDDTTCENGCVYWYVVRAANNSGMGPASDAMCYYYFDSPEVYVTSVFSNRIDLAWESIGECDGYYVYQYDKNRGKWDKIFTLEGQNKSYCLITGLQQNTEYQFAVEAYGPCQFDGWKIHTSCMSDTITVKTDISNGLVYETGGWYYYKDGVKQADYTGLLVCDTATYYIKNGRWNQYFYGLVIGDDGAWYYIYSGLWEDSYNGYFTQNEVNYKIENGKISEEYTGLIQDNDSIWYYIKKGKTHRDFSGLVEYDGTWYCIQNGVWENTYGGTYEYNNKWYFLQQGIWISDYTDLIFLGSNDWRYIKNGMWRIDYTGIAKIITQTDTKYVYIEKGRLQKNYTGLTMNEENELCYVTGGFWQKNYTGLVKHTDGEWYYVKDGIVQSSYIGLVKHTSGTWYYIKSGKKQGDYTGLVKWNNTWWYIRSGAMAGNYTGLAKHVTGGWYYIKNGRMQGNYTGLVKHTTGSWYYIKNGKMQNTYTGLVKHTTGTWYYVKNGKVQGRY